MVVVKADEEGADEKQHHLGQFGRTIIVNTKWDSFSKMVSRTITTIFFRYTLYK